MTRAKFDEMNELEERDLARRLAETSDVLDFEAALKVVKFNLAKAEKLLRMREEDERSEEELARAREERRLALLESR